ncbi:MAG TPA: ABC transporter ATP-binding protein, partial [Candidatus Ozemobacteraceae bacterium]|nr:ABC transporter ATP-binding protein [Candidatus Ozemobacteraceae bacterium]
IAAFAAAGVVHSIEGQPVPSVLAVQRLGKSFELERPFLKRCGDWWHGFPPARLQALSDVSFEVRAHETVGILGESGSGKSTLARVLMGLYHPDSGTAALQGRNLFSTDISVRLENLRNMQMIFQDPFSSLDPRMQVRRLLEEPLRIHEAGKKPDWRAKLENGLAEVGLESDVLGRYPSEFSGGQRQRIGICRALILNPTLLIADEAVSALDVSVQAQILELLRRLKEARGLSLLFISHDIAVVRQIADRVLVLYRGRIVETMPADCLLRDARHPYTRRLLGAALHLREGIELPDGAADEVGGNAASTAGCPCRDHCETAVPECAELPSLVEVHAGHLVACRFPRG